MQLKIPPKRAKYKRHSADPYLPVIRKLLQAQATVTHIYSVIQEHGYNKSLSTLRDYMTKLKKRVRNQKDEDIITISRYKLQAYLWFKRIPTCEEQTNFDKLFEEHETLYRLKSIIQAFQKLLNEQKNEQVLETWLIQAKENEIPEIQQFIKYIRTDIEAVKHALSYSWSNGLVEGHVNRLEVIKRQMYGRAKLDLLSRKVLYQTT